MLSQVLVMQRMNYELYNARMWTPRGYLALRLRIIPSSAKYTQF